MKSGEDLVQATAPVRISVVGEQWWWRVIYRHPDGRVTESSNEVRVPTGRPVEIEMTTADVIHSFWLPAYAVKVDMIPGHVNRLQFIANHAGIVRGQCAEYAGRLRALDRPSTEQLKPDNLMLPFEHLSEQELQALAMYLDGLE